MATITSSEYTVNGRRRRKIFNETTTAISQTYGGGDTHQTFQDEQEYVNGEWIYTRWLKQRKDYR